jgi:hypothetical protein
MRESLIERKVSEYAKSQGWLTYKFTSPSNRGVPDRIYLKEGDCFFIEFKAPDKQPTKLQKKVIKRIEDQDFYVYVIDSIENGRALFVN